MLQRCALAQVPTLTKLGQWFKNNMAALLNGLPKLPRYLLGSVVFVSLCAQLVTSTSSWLQRLVL
jgi:hypothetical protein